MNKRTKKIVTASASVAFAGLLLLANPTITSAKEYSAETWTPRTADEIKHDLDVLGEEGTTYTF